MKTSRKRPFYGWVIVAVATLITFSSSPGQSFGFSVFLDSIIEDTGLSRTVVSGLYAVGTGLSAAMVMFVSRMADRYGPRRTLGLVAVALGVACFGMAWSYHVVVLFISLAALRALGQGSIPVHSTLLIAQWFVKYRGRAVAITTMGFAVGSAAVPSLARMLIEAIGWRETYMVLGIAVWVLVLPANVLLVRNTPEEMGLHPDGASQAPANEPSARREPGARQVDRRKVLTSPAFWLLAFPLAIPSFVSTALIFHQVSIFAERGLSSSMAALVFVPYSIASAGTAFLGGFLVDRVGPRRFGSVVLLGLVGATVLVIYIETNLGAFAYAALLGAVGGGAQIISGVTWARYYGRFGLGRVQGSAMMVSISSAAVGPIYLAAMRTVGDGYALGNWAMAAMPLLGLVALSFARPQVQR